MATWRDVADALQQLIANALAVSPFPSTKVYVGWPEPNQLLKDLRTLPLGSLAHVSIFPWQKSALETRYLSDPEIKLLPKTESVDVVGAQVTFSGLPTSGDNTFVFVNGYAFGVTSKNIDTPTIICAEIAALINSANIGLVASVAGPVLTLTGDVWFLRAEVFGLGQVCKEIGRYSRRFQITTWATTNTSRELVSAKVQSLVAAGDFLTLSDGSKARVKFDGDVPSDFGMPSGVMRSDIWAWAEYADIQITTAPQVALVNLAFKALVGEIATEVDCSSATLLDTMPRHLHVHETPSGARPGTTFILKAMPQYNSEEVFLNGLKMTRRPYGTTLNVDEYTLLGATLVLWTNIVTGDELVVHYEA